MKNCDNCYYNGKNCKILREKIPKNCFAWADEAEAKRREKAIRDYNEPILPTAMSDDKKEAKRRNQERNLLLRGGKSSFEVLDEHYQELYEQNLSVTEIAEILHVDRNRVYDYKIKKNRSAPTETAM